MVFASTVFGLGALGMWMYRGYLHAPAAQGRNGHADRVMPELGAWLQASGATH